VVSIVLFQSKTTSACAIFGPNSNTAATAAAALNRPFPRRLWLLFLFSFYSTFPFPPCLGSEKQAQKLEEAQKA
jgi:hypothetical protein